MSKPRIFLQMAENGGVFVGTYGSTPYSEIVEHFTKGDIICIKRNIADDDAGGAETVITYQLNEVSKDHSNYTFYFKSFGAIDSPSIDSSNTWSIGNFNNYVPKSGITMTGPLIAQSNTNYTTPQVRNIIMSTQAPTATDGNNGDIWIQYSE